MVGIDRIQKRFDELAAMAEEVKDSTTKSQLPDERLATFSVDAPLALKWITSVSTLLHTVFGSEHPTTRTFENIPEFDYGGSKPSFDKRVAVFESAKQDFEGGYLFDVRNLVHASIFSDELAQAEHFLKEGYKIPAAVIAGVALETTLCELCDQHPDLEPAKADTMISNLAKKSIFNKMRADQLRAWMKIRNSAAHGKPDEFNDSDVTRMIEGVRDFIANHMR